MKIHRIGFLFAVLSIGLAMPSQAGVIFTLGDNPQPGDENVLLNNGTTGNTVFGVTNQSGIQVQFSSTQTLSEPSNGQARIEATNGTSQIALTDVTISVPGGFFGDLVFNPTITGTIGTSGGTATVTAIANDGTFPFTYTLGNGNNFLTITTTGGELLSSVSISYPTGFTDLRQVRISGLAFVPEPASIAMMGIGLGLLTCVGLRRRYRRRPER